MRSKPLKSGSESVVGTPALGRQLRTRPLELTVVVPTFNESTNVELLLGSLYVALEGTEWEVIFVDDDSPDDTAAVVRRLAQRDTRVRCIQRIGRRGLGSAVIEGMLASSAQYMAVIDGDMQHDERLLPLMLATLRDENLDVVIGSRHVAGGGLGNWDIRRATFSKIATKLARSVVPADLADPMSGFFILSRPAFERTVRQLSGQGFKILVDLFASTPIPYRFKEVPYTFRTRLHGESKLDGLIVWQYVMLLLDKWIGRVVPVRFVVFCAVGGSGVISHLLVLSLTLKLFSSFPIAQFFATGVAMTGNFVLNNILTYRDKQLVGKRFLSGLLRFYAICSVGILANVGIASVAFAQNYTWWISGLAGATISVVWNYSVSSIFTWNDE